MLFVLNKAKDQPSTKDRTNVELRTTLDNSHVTFKKQISNGIKCETNLKFIEDFIKENCLLSVTDFI